MGTKSNLSGTHIFLPLINGGRQNSTGPAPTQPPSGSDPQPGFPIRAAFYYPWFPEGWNQQGYNPFTNYHPSLGYYSARTWPPPRNTST